MSMTLRTPDRVPGLLAGVAEAVLSAGWRAGGVPTVGPRRGGDLWRAWWEDTPSPRSGPASPRRADEGRDECEEGARSDVDGGGRRRDVRSDRRPVCGGRRLWTGMTPTAASLLKYWNILYIVYMDLAI